MQTHCVYSGSVHFFLQCYLSFPPTLDRHFLPVLFAHPGILGSVREVFAVAEKTKKTAIAVLSYAINSDCSMQDHSFIIQLLLNADTTTER